MKGKKLNWKKIIINSLWLLAGAGTIVLLGAAMQKKNRLICKNIRIEIVGDAKNLFIDEKDVLEILNEDGNIIGRSISSLDLQKMESKVEKNLWVSNAEMYIDNNLNLDIIIEERQPVARVFTMDGGTFYLDSNALRLPLSEKLSARVPVFTGFPSNKPILSNPDSSLLWDMVNLAMYVGKDSFWMAQIAQIDVTPQAGFEIVPLIGDHLVLFGKAENVEQKFNNLYTFYRKAWLQNGINKYEKLDVQYTNQIVAIRKGATKVWADSAAALARMQAMTSGAGMAFPVSMDPSLKPMIDTGKTEQVPMQSQKITDNSKSTVSINNKTNQHTLSNEKKSLPKKSGKKNPKAVMNRN